MSEFLKNQFLLLNNAMDCVIDNHFFILFFGGDNFGRKREVINISQISSIKHKYTFFDKLYYFEINMISGRKIYVNQMLILEMGLFLIKFNYNEDYTKIENLIASMQ
jgi:hypothetical protein